MIARPFDYTHRDYDSILADLRRRMQIAIPEWTAYDAGFEAILLELFAMVGDVQNFYIDRMANEAYLQTAVLRESILNLAQMFGYTPAAQTAAACTVQFTKTAAALNETVVIPAGTRLFAQSPGAPAVFFETETALSIAALSSTGTVTATEGTTVSQELVGSGAGVEGQGFSLQYPNVIRNSVRVFTQDGPIDAATNQPTMIEWTYFQKIIDANFYDRAFTLYVDEDRVTYIIFGDAVSGIIPSVGTNVYVTYRYGDAERGNVGVGSIRSMAAPGAFATKIASLTNTTAASGGTAAESIESMRRSIPRSLATIERAVTLEDYAALGLRVAGVVKTKAAATVSTAVTLYVAPSGGGAPTTNLTNAVSAYFNGPPARLPIGTSLTVAAPTYVPINITLTVTVNARHRRDVVVNAITAKLDALYAFDVRNFADLLMKGEVFRDVVDTPGLDSVDITVFSRTGSGTADVQLAVNEIAVKGTFQVNATGGVVLV